jgi:catechol 2,3-dioxygenase-like lactoylglutathione lyase family enzyme
MIEFLQIKETCIYVKDLENARKFYEEKLGLSQIGYMKDKHLFLRAGTSVLLLFNPHDSKNKKSPPPHYGGGKQHFAFEVKAEQYQAVKSQILASGIKIIDEVTWPSGSQSFYFNDPEGNVLEILPEKGVWN